MSQTGRKKRVARGFLVQRDFEALDRWASAERNPLRPLTLLLFDEELTIRWRAIEAIGRVSQQEYQREPDRIRRLIRRLLWLMNDESGGVCWNAPEAIAEVLHNVPELVSEYAPLLPSFFEMEPFEKGSRWGVARIAAHSPLTSDTKEVLTRSLQHPDPEIRGLSLLALEAFGYEAKLEEAASIQIYDFETKEVVLRTIAKTMGF